MTLTISESYVQEAFEEVKSIILRRIENWSEGTISSRRIYSIIRRNFGLSNNLLGHLAQVTQARLVEEGILTVWNIIDTSKSVPHYIFKFGPDMIH